MQRCQARAHVPPHCVVACTLKVTETCGSGFEAQSAGTEGGATYTHTITQLPSGKAAVDT